MRRREFIAGLGSVAAWPVVGRAQQSSKIHRVAWVSASEPVADMNESSGDRGYRAFLEELRQLGSIEGRNLILERYSGDRRTERYSELANDVVRTKPDLIFTVRAQEVCTQAERFALPRLTSLPRRIMRPFLKLTSSRICDITSHPARCTAGGMNLVQMSRSLRTRLWSNQIR